jgi:uncharacterized repeat protein (TIGR01451 family)
MSRRLDRSGRPARQTRTRRLTLELLEGRDLMTAIPPVTTTADSGTGSLRAAIIALDADPVLGADTISFAIPGSGPQTIALQSPLPVITHAVAIDGTTQTGYFPNDTPLVVIDGSGAGAGANGLTLTAGADGSTIRGLAIVGFTADPTSGAGGNGIYLAGSVGSNSIQGCYLGVGADGSTAKANTSGILVLSPNNTIGGLTSNPLTTDLISGNTYAGVILGGSSATGNVVAGDSIGTNAASTGAAGNQQYGVVVMTSGNTIGGTAAGAGNVISGNTGPNTSMTTGPIGAGILFEGKASSNLVEGNKIGTNASGSAVLPQSNGYSNVYGIYFGTPGNTSNDSLVQETVGGTVAGAGNLISGNFTGITGNVASSLIAGNTIGLNLAGTATIGNGNGILLGAGLTTIGGTTPLARNIISGSNTATGAAGTGFDLSGDSDLVEGNFIGLTSGGLAATGTGNVVGMNLNLTNSTIGSTVIGASNLIAGNSSDAILLLGFDTSIQAGDGNDSLIGNVIGLDIQGNPDPNAGNGINVTVSAPSTTPTTPLPLDDTIGGTALGAGNTIAYSGGAGVVVNDGYPTGITGLSIRGNSIFGNAKLGIDTQGTGVPTASTLFLNGVSVANGQVTVTGVYFAAPGTTVSVDLFADGTDSTGFGQGKVFLGTVNTTTSGSGFAVFTPSFPVPASGTNGFSATVTDAGGNTSDFTENFPTPTNLPVANLVVQNSATSTSLVVGQTVTLVEKVFNLGPDAANNVVLYDPLPVSLSNVTLVTSQGTATLGANNMLSVNFGSLAPNTFAAVAITAQVSLSGTLVDQAGASSTVFDPNYLDNTTQQTLTVAQANAGPTTYLTIAETATPASALVSSPVTFTLSVGNAGPNSATNVLVNDFLPAGAILDGVTSSQGGPASVNGTYLSINVGPIAAGGIATVTIVVTPTAAGSITNSANVSGSPEFDTNKTSTNETSLTLPVTAGPPSIHFYLAQNAFPATGAPGVFQAFTMTVENFGPDVATNVFLIDNLPADVTFYRATPSQGGNPSLTGSQLSENFGTLAAGAVASLQLIIIPNAIGTITNVAGVYTPDVPSAAPSFAISSVSIVAGPSVTALNGFGGNAQLVISFNEDLNPTTATNPANFQLVAMGTNGKTTGKTINIASITYNSISHSVMILPAQALDPKQYYKITVFGSTASGVTDTLGRKLSSTLYGPAGGNFSALFFAGSLPQL